MAHAERPLSLPARTAADPDPAVAEVLTESKRRTGRIPHMYGRMANVPGLLQTYLTGYAALRQNSDFTPAELQLVLLAISRENGCEYCVAAHSALADAARVPTELVDAVREGGPLTDARLDALVSFTIAMSASRGLPSAVDLDAFLAQGYTEYDVLQIVLAIGVKTLSNYTNHLFHTPIDPAFAARSWTEHDAG